MNDTVSSILDIFRQISAIPRPSKREGQIREWLVRWGKGLGLQTQTDRVGNVLMRVPATPAYESAPTGVLHIGDVTLHMATPAYESAPTIVLQSHMDMVCERRPDIDHDFERDPIEIRIDGDWVRSVGTTLGADDGIGMALALHTAIDDSLEHPPLELLFTVDEETGLNGAGSLAPEWLKGRILFNLDSEREGVFTIGCAGGRNTVLGFPVEYEQPPADWIGVRLTVGGFPGGHSGVDIHRSRGNAIRSLVRLLERLCNGSDARLTDIAGGSAHNAIPREAWATLLMPSAVRDRLDRIATTVELQLQREYRHLKAPLSVRVEAAPPVERVFTDATTMRLIDLLLVLPDGPIILSPDLPGRVETSCNLAEIGCRDGMVQIMVSQRSLLRSTLDELSLRIVAAGRLAGSKLRVENEYNSWDPDWNSDLLRRASAVYRTLFGRDPAIEITHAGLEAGVIGNRYEGMQVISFGPTINGMHSPDECLHIPSVEATYRFIAALLASWQ